MPDFDALDFFRDRTLYDDPYPTCCRAFGRSTLNSSGSSNRRGSRFASLLTIITVAHGPAGRRDYKYAPTYLLRGLARLHLELTPAG